MPYTKKENALSDEQQNIFRKLHDTENLLDKPNVMVKNIFFLSACVPPFDQFFCPDLFISYSSITSEVALGKKCYFLRN